MKTKILTLVVLIGLTTSLMAQPDLRRDERPNRGKNPEMQMKKNVGHQNILNLTDEQKEVFKQSRLALEKQLQPLRNELGEAEAHQRTLTTTEKPDISAINKNMEKIGSIKTEMAKMQIKHRMELRAQLTDEQQLMFDRFDHRKAAVKGADRMHQRGRF